MEMPPEARKRIESEEIVWLTTVTDSGAPAPNQVWFVPDGTDLVVFAAPSSVKVHNIEARPKVSLHFNTEDPDGADAVVLTGTATVEPGVRPSTQAGYLDKYREAMTRINLSVEDMDAGYDTRIRITPTRVRLAV